MQPSRKLALALLAPLTLLVMTSATLAADPGLSFPIASEVSDQKAGSLLIYNAYTSSQTTPGTQDSRVSITNTSSTAAAFVHLFFVDGATCSIADSFLCLTANETSAFLASDVDPGVSGYIVALAVNFDGVPAVHNFLIGSVYVKYASGHAGKLGAEAFTKLTDTNVLSTDGTLAALFFDGLPLAVVDQLCYPIAPQSPPMEMAMRILAGSQATIRYGFEQAMCLTQPDEIRLPWPRRFTSGEALVATALHELVHWSGHPERLHRAFGNRFGDAAYAFEELVAELGSAFLLGHCGLVDATIEGHAAYLDSWLKVLRNDRTAIFTAARHAGEAFEYILVREMPLLDTAPVLPSKE